VKYSGGVLQISKFSSSSFENAPGLIEISEIPPNMTKDKLIMFLENTKRSGGGKISDIQYREYSKMALVAFEDQEGKNFL